MCLRQLALSISLLVATASSHAEAVHAEPAMATLQQGAAFAANGHGDGHHAPSGLAHASLSVPTPVGTRPATSALTPSQPSRPLKSAGAREEPNAPRDLKSLLALVSGLALVGWIQRRRPEG